MRVAVLSQEANRASWRAGHAPTATSELIITHRITRERLTGRRRERMVYCLLTTRPADTVHLKSRSTSGSPEGKERAETWETLVRVSFLRHPPSAWRHLFAWRTANLPPANSISRPASARLLTLVKRSAGLTAVCTFPQCKRLRATASWSHKNLVSMCRVRPLKPRRQAIPLAEVESDHNLTSTSNPRSLAKACTPKPSAAPFSAA